MQFDSSLHSDRPVPALVGNGRLVTTLGRSGYHDPEAWPSSEAATQELVVAGRRLGGAHHELIPFGTLERSIWIGGEEPTPIDQSQSIHTDIAEVRSRTLYDGLLESTRTLVLAHRNTLYAETRIANHSSDDHEVFFLLRFRWGHRNGEPVSGIAWHPETQHGSTRIAWECGDNLGEIGIATDGLQWKVEDGFGTMEAKQVLSPGDELVIRTLVWLSDRIEYQDAPTVSRLDADFHRHLEWWRDFWGRSDVSTGLDEVDRFRWISLYTIACQATPWSVPPTVSQRHWGAGAFHDELYPFLGMLSAGHAGLASRVPYYRLSTLSKAVERANGRGALFPWSATEDGLERDPHGHWYTERFHLGQIAACAWFYWLYERRLSHLEDLYPLVREAARYFEHHMLERDERGNLRTKACTDFDESVGQVRRGPFTMAAAAFALDRAAEGARRLGTDRERRSTWERLAGELRQNFVIDLGARSYGTPDGKPSHYSVIGYVVPFFCDDGSEFAKNTAALVHEACRGPLGFRPGANDAFEGTAWMWTAGHLAMCHSVLGDGELAWDAIRAGPASAGQFLSPNEHALPSGEPVVPWFTTGCGAWLAGLHWMFARVDDVGDHLMPAIPESLGSFSFRGLRLSRGVSASVRVDSGVATYISLHAPWAMNYGFEVPAKYVASAWPTGLGKIEDMDGTWRVQLELSQGENTLIEAADTARAAHR